MRKELRRPFPMNNTGRTWKLPMRTRGGGRLHAPSRRIHDGSNGGSGPGPRSSPFRMQKDSGSPAAAPPDGKSPMRPKRVRRACRSMGSGAGDGRPAIGWKAREASATVRMRSSAAPGACAHAGHASRTLFANAAAAIFLRSLSNAAIFLRRICLCSLSTAAISLCRYYVGHNATAAILRRYSLLQLYSTVDITATAAILTSHTHTVLPTHLTPSSLKVSHRSSSLPP